MHNFFYRILVANERFIINASRPGYLILFFELSIRRIQTKLTCIKNRRILKIKSDLIKQNLKKMGCTGSKEEDDPKPLSARKSEFIGEANVGASKSTTGSVATNASSKSGPKN